MTNPFGYDPGDPFGMGIGLGSPVMGVGISGTAAEVKGDGRTVDVLQIQRGESGGCNGMASVHVFCRDVTLENGEVTPNAMLLVDVSWQRGIACGDFTADATRGLVFAVGADTTITMKARLVPNVPGATLHIWATKRVEATVQWGTSINPKAPYYAPQRITLAPAVESAWIAIPQQAESMIVLADEPSRLPNLEAQFSTSNIVGAGILFATLNPNANGTPIVGGSEFVRFLSPADMIVMPVFQLWT